jgi:hypothetical protein
LGSNWGPISSETCLIVPCRMAPGPPNDMRSCGAGRRPQKTCGPASLKVAGKVSAGSRCFRPRPSSILRCPVAPLAFHACWMLAAVQRGGLQDGGNSVAVSACQGPTRIPTGGQIIPRG